MNFHCYEPDKNGFCTCSASFETCACRPLDTSGAPTTCADCQTTLYAVGACGDCEHAPCTCHDGWRVGRALDDARVLGLYGPLQLPQETP